MSEDQNMRVIPCKNIDPIDKLVTFGERAILIKKGLHFIDLGILITDPTQEFITENRITIV